MRMEPRLTGLQTIAIMIRGTLSGLKLVSKASRMVQNTLWYASCHLVNTLIRCVLLLQVVGTFYTIGDSTRLGMGVVRAWLVLLHDFMTRVDYTGHTVQTW